MSECGPCTEPGFWKKAWSFIRAMCSKRDKVLGTARLTICRTANVEKLKPNGVKFKPCEYLDDSGKKPFCNLCGCPKTGILSNFSNLEFKTTLTKAQCPEEKW